MPANFYLRQLLGVSLPKPDTEAQRAGVTAAALALGEAAEAGARGLPDVGGENGTGSGTAAVGASGDQRIDGLLVQVRWNGAISYGDPDSAADYQTNHPEKFTNFQQVNAGQLLATHAALNDAASAYGAPAAAYSHSVEGFTNLSVTYAGAGTGAATIRLANTSDYNTAFGYYPNSGSAGGDVLFGNSGRSPVAGNYDHHTVIHELGHALGLKHGQETSHFGALPANVDSMEYSVMTYRSYIGGPTTSYANEFWGHAQTFMMLDIAALQHMYGADFFHNGGNTTYSWDPLNGRSFVNGQLAIDPGGNRIFQTIWDGNGTDTYDLSNYATNLVVDLNPGGHSTFSDVQRAFLGGGPNGGYARGNVFNALQFNNDARSLIENAVGGSGHDAITGNAAANTLSGSAGNDTLSGAGGVDTLHGGAGDDRLDGGLYADASFGGDGNDSFVVMGGDVADHVDGGAGIDTLDVSGHTNTTLGFSINLQTGRYDFVPTGFGPFSVVAVENVLGSARADTIVGANLANRLEGNAGNDVIQGNGGNDTLEGGDGDDTLQGGEGNDVVEGGGGTDDARGGNGNDRFVFNLGFGYPNRVTGGAGTDTFDFTGIGGGFSGASLVIDLVAGYSDVDGTMSLAELENVLGSDSAETIRGSGGANQLFGFGGNDTIVGGSGNDTLNGGFGNDRLTGGAGRDVLTGGAGADRFIFAAASNSPNNAATCDLLVAGGGGSAFDLPGAGNGDRIDLSALPGTLGWSDIRLQNVGGNTVCLIDVSGSAAADMRIQINDGAVGAGAYGAADFVF